MKYRIEMTGSAQSALGNIADRRIQQEILNRILKLAEEPEKQGKALVGNLSGYRSVRAVGQRYRIIYRIRAEQVVVVVVMLGLRKDRDRKDVYTLAKKLLAAGLLK